MKALNEKEREGLFWQFFVGALIVVLVLVATIYTTMDLPIELTNFERVDLNNSRSILRNQKKVVKQIQYVDSLTSQIQGNSNPDNAISFATNENTKLLNFASQDSSQALLLNAVNKILANNILLNKRLIGNGNNQSNDLIKCQSENNRLQNELIAEKTRCETEKLQLQRQLPAPR